MYNEKDIIVAKDYIINKIKSSNYPFGHPFLDPRFENDLVLSCLIMIKLYIRETGLIDDYIEKKFRAVKNGEFYLESYFQNLNEFMLFYYLFNALTESDMVKKLQHIHYEPKSQADNEKQLEYSFIFSPDPQYDFYVNFEVKTITCDPFLRAEGAEINFEQRLIKRFFHDVDLTQLFSVEQLKEYVVLHESTHRRQIAKNIKKINEKFKKSGNVMNVGVIVVQFATSLEEFYAYLFHPEKGILYDADFSNLDCLVFFSLTNLTDIDMQGIYDSGHIFTMLFDEHGALTPYLKAFKLDNIVSVGKKVAPYLLEDAKKEFGIYRYVASHGVTFFVPEDASEESISAYGSLNSKTVHNGIVE